MHNTDKVGGRIRKFPDLPPGARTANGTVLEYQPGHETP